MIIVFCSKDGYYLAGEDFEATKQCSPAINDDGESIIPPLILSYMMLSSALSEISGKRIDGDVIVYASTRIIEELNGSVEPLDPISKNWRNFVRRNIIPGIKSVVVFRKKSSDYIANNISFGNKKLLVASPMELMEIEKEKIATFKQNSLSKFKEDWLWPKV